MEYKSYDENQKEQPDNQSPINNIYINTNPQKNKKNKPKQDNKINHFDNFTQNDSNMEFFIEEDASDFDNLDYNDNFDIVNQNTTKKDIQKIIKYSTLICLGLFVLILFFHNVITFKTINKDIHSNQQTITTNELILKDLQNELNLTINDELKNTFNDNGYILIENNNLKTYTPNQKKVPPIYNPKTNWFNNLCDNIFDLFS
ncbi:MAG: hypothetical protein IJW82_04575 [Clostridia bacterium]|nr:hypothetical protein [Clostridia bacterium]